MRPKQAFADLMVDMRKQIEHSVQRIPPNAFKLGHYGLYKKECVIDYKYDKQMKRLLTTTLTLICFLSVTFGQNENTENEIKILPPTIDSTCIKNSLNCTKYNDKLFSDYIDTLQLNFLSEVGFKLNRAINYEKGVESKEITYNYTTGIGSSYYPNTNNFKLENPIIFNRIECPYLSMETQYFYTAKDNSIKVVAIKWNEFNRNEALADEEFYIKRRIKVFKEKFSKIENAIIKRTGKPTNRKLDQTENINGTMDEIIWNNTKGLNVNLELVYDDSDCRMRLTIYNN